MYKQRKKIYKKILYMNRMSGRTVLLKESADVFSYWNLYNMCCAAVLGVVQKIPEMSKI